MREREKAHICSRDTSCSIISNGVKQLFLNLAIDIGCPEKNSLAIRSSFALTYLKQTIAATID